MRSQYEGRLLDIRMANGLCLVTRNDWSPCSTLNTSIRGGGGAAEPYREVDTL